MASANANATTAGDGGYKHSRTIDSAELCNDDHDDSDCPYLVMEVKRCTTHSRAVQIDMMLWFYLSIAHNWSPEPEGAPGSFVGRLGGFDMKNGAFNVMQNISSFPSTLLVCVAPD